MRPGGGKHKGSAFEREVCKKLSLWVSEDRRHDLFWRSAMSGGRATVHGTAVRQVGDIAATALEGHRLTDRYAIECKHVRDLDFMAFLLHDKGLMARFWLKLRQQANTHEKLPMLIAKQNRMPAIVVLNNSDSLGDANWRVQRTEGSLIMLFNDLLRLKPWWS